MPPPTICSNLFYSRPIMTRGIWKRTCETLTATLEHLSRDAFQAEVLMAIQCIDFGGIDAAERLAKSYGL